MVNWAFVIKLFFLRTTPATLLETCFICMYILIYTQSGSIGNVVASHAEGWQGRFPAKAAPIYTVHEALRGYGQGHLQYRPVCTTLCGWLIHSFSSVIKTFLQYFSIEDTHFMNKLFIKISRTFVKYKAHPGLELYKALVRPLRVEGATSQLDLSSLTPLSVAGRGWLQLGVAHMATSVALLKVVDNFDQIGFFSVGLLTIEDFTFLFVSDPTLRHIYDVKCMLWQCTIISFYYPRASIHSTVSTTL